MRVDANVQVKNEALLLEQVLPEWDSYPIDHFVFYDWIMSQALDHKLMAFQWNVVGDLGHYRCDPSYYSNYRDFIFPVEHTDKFDRTLWRYHSPRTPNINAPVGTLHDDQGFVHLQALNVRFYALKQLWYKTFEYLHYDKTVDDINAAYDPVVNGLDFCSRDMPAHILSLDTFDSGVFDRISKERGYVDYILEYSVPELITFGEEYLR